MLVAGCPILVARFNFEDAEGGRGQHITDMSEKDFTAEVMILRMLLKLVLRLLENKKMVGQAPPYKLTRL